MLKNIFICPDCSLPRKESNLKFNNDKELFCPNCNRKFYVKENFIDLLPIKPTNLGSEVKSAYKNYYLSQFDIKPDTQFTNPIAWGESKYFSRGAITFLKEEEELIRGNYSKSKEVYCDISGSQGNLAFEASKHFRNVYLCDINLEYLQRAIWEARKLSIKNVLFVRADYFNIPFRKNCIDTCVSTDSFLYYGIVNDIKVIQGIFGKLVKRGVFLFDLHHRKFYSPDSRIIEYSRKEYILLKNKFKNIVFVPLSRVPTVFTNNHFLFRLFSHLIFLPPIRYFCILQKE